MEEACRSQKVTLWDRFQAAAPLHSLLLFEQFSDFSVSEPLCLEIIA